MCFFAPKHCAAAKPIFDPLLKFFGLLYELPENLLLTYFSLTLIFFRVLGVSRGCAPHNPSGVSGVAMLPVGALCFYHAHLGARCFHSGHFGRISSTLYFTVFQSLGGNASAWRASHEPRFRQAHCFVQGRLRFLPAPPIPHAFAPTFVGFRLNGL